MQRKGAARGRSEAVITDRDRVVLMWIGEQYGATYAHLAILLGRCNGRGPISDSGVRQQVSRWLRAGLVTCHRPLSAIWVTLTQRGYDLVGLKLPRWKAPPSRLRHCDAVNRVRLWYESSPSRVSEGGVWICERRLFSRRGLADWHVADAELAPPGDSVTAVEVELTLKQPANRYVSEVLGRLRPDVFSVLYLCPPTMTSQLGVRLDWALKKAGLVASVEVVVRALPVGLPARP